MKFPELLRILADEPVFETGFLFAGDVDPRDVRRQLSRWVRAGRIEQLRRGLYCLGAPYRRIEGHPFLVANRLVQPSYVSLQSALAHHGLIPEHVPVVTSVTRGRSGRFQYPSGSFQFRHVAPTLFRGFREVEIQAGQSAWVATPEKALIDLIYLEKGGDSSSFLEGLRLQNLEKLDLGALRTEAAGPGKPKLLRALSTIEVMAREEAKGFDDL